MSARSALRTATADEHRRVDAIYSRFQLERTDGYRAYLRATAAAHLPAEQALEEAGAGRFVPDWPERRRAHLLRNDLDALGELPARPIAVAPLAGEAPVLGALYVLEGSRLGGAILRKQLAPHVPQAFLSAPAQAGSWRRLSILLDRNLADRQMLDQAIHAACQVFASFAAAGLTLLEPVQ